MFDRVLEWAAARRNRRFQLYREARLTYESYIGEHLIQFDLMTEEDYRHAAADSRLQAAERGYREAVALTRPAGLPHDLAAALSQLGMLLHLRRRFAEARDSFHEAIEILDAIARPGPDEQQVLSSCQYHLGLLNLKEGHYAAARRRLEISVALDEQLGDLSGQAIGQSALRRCPADEGTPEPVYKPSVSPLRALAQLEPEPDYRAAEGESPDLPLFGATTRDALWIMAASETSVAQLRDTARKACPKNRRLVISTAAAESGALTPPSMSPGTSLCGAIFEVSPAALASEDFRYWIAWCINRACEAADFRLFVHLKDLTEDTFVGLAARDAVVGELRDKVQIHQPDSLDSLEKHLRMHLLRLEMTRDAAKWRRVRRFGIRFVGGISAQVLWLSILFWLGVSAGALLFGKARLIAALVSLAPSRDWIGMLGGMPLVWAYLIPLAMLMQGWKHGLTVMARTSRVWWLVFALAVVKASIWLPQQIHCAKGAIAAGATLGLLMEISRRGKEKGARRNLLSVGREIARMSSLPRSIMQPGRADPRQWPLFVSGSKVFISYSRSSKWGNASADLLHQRLKSVGADSFLDRQSIPPGASWQYQLDEQIGDVPVFIAFCDGCSVERPWVAAEVAAALAGRHSSGFPEIFLVREPSLTPSVLDRSLPVFRDVFRWAEAGSEGAPQVITVRDENSIVNLAASLAPGRLQRAAVFPEGFRLFLIALTFPHIFLSSLVPILGLPALLVGISVQLGKVDLDAWFGPATLWWIAVAGAYALGTTIRQAIGARYDGVGQRQDRLSFAAMRLFAIGFAALGAHLWRRIDGVGLAWAATALWLGWLLTFVYIEGMLTKTVEARIVAYRDARQSRRH